MSLSDRIEVHYINIDRRTNATSRDVYIIDDAAVDGDKLAFSWLISGNATKYYGRLNFIILLSALILMATILTSGIPKFVSYSPLARVLVIHPL